MPKVLAEFLQEQQQPFALDLYLLERGYSNSTLTTPNVFSNSAKIFKCSSRFGLKNKRRYVIPSCSAFVKAVFSSLVFDNNSQKINISGNFTFSCSDRSSNVFDSCSPSYEENTDCLGVDLLSPEKEGNADRKLKWRRIEDDNSKQLSPVSVLEETDQSHEASSLHYKEYNLKRRKRESWSSTSSQCKSKQQTNSIAEETQELVDSNSYHQYMINKKTLQQTTQLLIDCVRELIENQRKKTDKNRQELNKILGADELWKLVCENVWSWSQDESNIDQILHHDYLDSVQGWTKDFEQQKEAISMEIGDALLEDIINDLMKLLS